MFLYINKIEEFLNTYFSAGIFVQSEIVEIFLQDFPTVTIKYRIDKTAPPGNTNTENILSISDGFNGNRQARIALDNVFSDINPKMSAIKW